MVGKKFPDQPEVKRFVKGHIYLFEHDGAAFSFLGKIGLHKLYIPVIAMFIKKYLTVGIPRYFFVRLARSPANNGVRLYRPITDPRMFLDVYCIKNYRIQEIPHTDLPLYISWYTYPDFAAALKHGPQLNKLKLRRKSMIKKELNDPSTSGRNTTFKRLTSIRNLVIPFRRKHR